jgi:hypothetical protein
MSLIPCLRGTNSSERHENGPADSKRIKAKIEQYKTRKIPAIVENGLLWTTMWVFPVQVARHADRTGRFSVLDGGSRLLESVSSLFLLFEDMTLAMRMQNGSGNVRKMPIWHRLVTRVRKDLKRG